jgi:cell wall assembly regulator SMI1
MDIAINDCEARLSAEGLNSIEKKLGIVLPDEYRSFLLKHNGGRPRPKCVFHFKNENGKSCDSMVDWFLAIYDGEHDNFETYYKLYKAREARLPKELIPIAHDPGGNLICIAVSGEKKGSVFFWDHEKEADEHEPADYRNVYLITNSFNEFIASLSESK